MAVNIYVNFNGNCREAVEFYAKVFGIEKPRIMTFGDMRPDPGFPLTEETKALVLNTSLIINGSNVRFSDCPPGKPVIVGNNISLIIENKNIDEIKSLFNKLKEGGSVTMEPQETFWTKCYGFVIDKYGIGWQLSHDNGKIKI